MDLIQTIASYIKLAGSVASIALGVYFIIKSYLNKRIAKKPLKDAKKRDKMIKQFALLSKELGITQDEVKKDEKIEK